MPNTDERNPRQNRYPSHALVEIRKFKRLPLKIHSAVLLDISLGGFKVEYTSDVTTKPGDTLWISIPLGPLGIYAPSKLTCKVECRWFDGKRFRIGGVFMELSKTERHIIDQVVETLKSRGAISH
jgi:hypothetical protein